MTAIAFARNVDLDNLDRQSPWTTVDVLRPGVGEDGGGRLRAHPC